MLSNAPISGLPQDRGGGGRGSGQPTGIRISEAHVGREFDILNVPRVGNLTQPPSWKMEDQGMSDKKSVIFENTQQSFGSVYHILMSSFLCEGWHNETCFLSFLSFITKSILSLSIEK